MTLSSYKKNAHCSFCGQRFAEEAGWPRKCSHCNNTSFINLLPVAVMLLPIDTGSGVGLLTIRRAIQPRLGELALPGGFIDLGESWQEACAREVREEAEIEIDPQHVQLFNVHTALDGYLLIFGRAPVLRLTELPPFRPTPEVSERVILSAATELAFPLHTKAMQEFFA